MEDKELRNWTIDIDKIPKEKLRYFARKDGSQGVSLDITSIRMKATDRYGYTHTMWVRQTREEREREEPLVYVGRGKAVVRLSQQQQSNDDDIPY